MLLHALISATLFTTLALETHQEDTIAAARILSFQSCPVTRPAEEIYLPAQKAVPILVSDAIKRFTGVQVKDYGGIGGLKTVNVRSLGSEHVGIFIDGIQVDNAQNMQVDLGRFSSFDLSSISLYTGQKTRRLQSAKEYASGTSLYLETLPPSLIDGSALRLRLQSGSFDTFGASIQYDKSLGKIILCCSGEIISSSGRYPYHYFDTTLVRENGDILGFRLETRLFGVTGKGDWRLRAYAYGSERGFPGPVIRRAMGFPFSAERQADRDIFIQGNWNENWSALYGTSVKFKYSNNYTHYNTHAEKNPMALPYDLHYIQQAFYGSLAQSISLGEKWAADLSTDLQHNALDSDAGMSARPRRFSFFGTFATRFHSVAFRAAAQLSYIAAWDSFKTPKTGGWTQGNSYRDACIPSLSLAWNVSQSVEIDAWAKRSYRLPSFNDLYYSLIGNSSLLPESVTQCGSDLRIKQDDRPWSFDIRISPFLNRVNNKIVAIPTSSQFRWTMLNIGKVEILGAELKATADFKREDLCAGLTLRYSFQEALDRSDAQAATYGKQIPYIPRHSGTADLSIAFGEWYFTWDSTFTGVRWSRTANTDDYRIGPWSISDVSIARNFRLKSRLFHQRTSLPEVCASINFNNIFDTHYEIVRAYPMPGFNVIIRLEVEI